MKLSNKTLLISLLAATTALTACKEDKNNTATKPAETQQAQPVQQNAKPQLAAFNSAVQLKVVERNIVENENKEQGSAFVYEINNIGDKAIKNMSWAFAYQYENQIIYAHPFSVNFDSNLAPKAMFKLNFVVPFAQVPEQFRSIFADPKAAISSITIAREIEFSDGSKIVVED